MISFTAGLVRSRASNLGKGFSVRLTEKVEGVSAGPVESLDLTFRLGWFLGHFGRCCTKVILSSNFGGWRDGISRDAQVTQVEAVFSGALAELVAEVVGIPIVEGHDLDCGLNALGGVFISIRSRHPFAGRSAGARLLRSAASSWDVTEVDGELRLLATHKVEELLSIAEEAISKLSTVPLLRPH